MHKIILIPILCILFSCQQKTNSQKAADGEPRASRDSLTHTLHEILKQGHINGFSVAIVNGDKTLYKNGFGYADVAQKKPYMANTVQNIGSISKTLIGIALLKAQEMGKLKLDDPINKYLPFEVKNPYYPEVPITIRHLSTHTSTIKDTEYYEKSYITKDPISVSDRNAKGMPDYFNGPKSQIPLMDFLEKILSDKGEWYQKEGYLVRRPGDLFEYSNVAATLAAVVLERATGEKFNKFTAEHILEPLAMDASGWSFDEIDFEEHSTLYADPKTPLPPYSLITYPDGGFRTSAADLGKYLTELIKGYTGEGTLLNTASYTELFTEQLKAGNFLERNTENPFNDEFNTGIFMGFSAKGNIGHTGGDPGVSTFLFFNQDTKLGRLLIVNTDLGEEGKKEFFEIWTALGDYENKWVPN